MHEPVLVDADIHERTEIGDVGHDAGTNHSRFQVRNFVDVFSVIECLELAARIPSRL